jgi:radical SAM protein with 4Fe4S-binding SPASM domain
VELLRDAHSNGLIGLYLSGGDIMCYPHIFELLDLMEELEFPPFGFPTKAYVSPDVAARFAEYKVLDRIQLSIDSSVPEIADFLVASPGFYKRTIESIRNLQDAGVESISVKAVITPYNLPTIPKFYRDMKTLGVSDITMATYCKSGFRHKDRLFNHSDDYEWLDKQLQKLRDEFPDDDIRYQNGEPQDKPQSKEEREELWAKRSRCTAGRDNLTITPNGMVVACEQMPEREEDYMGDLRVQSIEEVWNSKAMDEYLFRPPRERFVGTACYDCEDFDDCQTLYGQCVRNCCIHYGTRWQVTPSCPRAPEPIQREF